ncbi:SRPBCC domain-containing protein [Glutamicibacter sp.]|uniref:ArsR/SmtB family transcription factor n=1 Tax=Glutamicibacter sp. TaxID=1931995 RepID=UPI0028BE531E|nr:SRPBCC domain-containing protein [Glutamicibacter sp.]
MKDMEAELGLAFKALADPTRRLLLDQLRHHDGQTLTELCGKISMARQSITQHLDILAAAHLITVVRRGRERLHFLNPTPIHAIGERWISAYEVPRLETLSAIKHRAEDSAMTNSSTPIPTYVYVTYIRASAEEVWNALTDADLTAQYWGHANISDWQPGSPWEHRRVDGSDRADVTGQVLSVDPPNELVITFEDSDEPREHGSSVVHFNIEPHEGIVRLTVRHENLPNLDMRNGIARGWPAVLANLKSLLETGSVLPTAPWNMPERELS